MPSLVRRMQKRILKKRGYHREASQRIETGPDGVPFVRNLRKDERMILDADGKPVGPHYPRLG